MCILYILPTGTTINKMGINRIIKLKIYGEGKLPKAFNIKFAKEYPLPLNLWGKELIITPFPGGIDAPTPNKNNNANTTNVAMISNLLINIEVVLLLYQ